MIPTIDISQLKGLADSIKKALKIDKAETKAAMTEGLQPMFAEAQALVAKDTMELHDSIKTFVKENAPGIRVGVTVGKGLFKGETFYGGFIELGYRRGKRPSKGIVGTKSDTREQVPAQPFLRPAFDLHIQGLTDHVAAYFRKKFEGAKAA